MGDGELTKCQMDEQNIKRFIHLEVDKDVVTFLEHHDSVLIEASQDVIAGDDDGLVKITGGIEKEETDEKELGNEQKPEN